MSEKFINREISWLSFNYRVLQEAMDESVPLIERIRFLGIYSNNRDEFYKVRVALLKRMAKIDKAVTSSGIDSPIKILESINAIIASQEKLFNQTLNHLYRELKERRIFIVRNEEVSPKQAKFITQYYESKLKNYLFPIILNNVKNDLFIKDGSSYLAVEMIGSQTEYAIIKIPHRKLGRFVLLPTKNRNRYFMFLDDIIRFNLKELFKKYDYHTFNAYTIRVTRDAELDFNNDDVSKTFFAQIQESLHRRKAGAPVRFIYDGKMPQEMLDVLKKILRIQSSDHTKSSGRYHNMRDLISFPVFSKHYVYGELPPLRHYAIDYSLALLDNVRNKDILMHYPYHDFALIINLLKEASFDGKVTEINITLYRLASYSNIINSLVNAARNGKKVRVLLEAQARFDEEANLNLVKKLQSEGVHIIPLIKGFKVHSKVFSIVRKESEGTRYYSYIGTGNFNESSAKVYTDLGLLTYNQEIGKEAYSIFKLIENRFVRPVFNHLVLSPFDTRHHYETLINQEIENAKAGKKAWILAKMNSLSDKQMVEKLYEASASGVKIDLIVRGICILKPGIPDLSDNIRVISIIDRFLEHSRIFTFCNDGDTKMYISSADWMVRNIDNRIEVATPIYDQTLQNEIMDILQIQLQDNVKARIVDANNTNQYVKEAYTKQKVRSQIDTYTYYKNKL